MKKKKKETIKAVKKNVKNSKIKINKKSKPTKVKAKVLKSSKPKVVKRVTRTKKPKIVKKQPTKLIISNVDDVYQFMHKIQLYKEPIKFLVTLDDSFVVDNIIRDLNLLVVKKAKPNKKISIVEYKVSFNPANERIQSFEELEEYQDELFDDGRLFFN